MTSEPGKELGKSLMQNRCWVEQMIGRDYTMRRRSIYRKIKCIPIILVCLVFFQVQPDGHK